MGAKVIADSNCNSETYEVVTKRVAIRKEPQDNAQVFTIAKMGDNLELYEWDETQNYRKTFTDHKGYHLSAWVMVKHPELGILLQPCKKSASICTPCRRCGKIEEGMGDIGLCDACFTISFDI